MIKIFFILLFPFFGFTQTAQLEKLYNNELQFVNTGIGFICAVQNTSTATPETVYLLRNGATKNIYLRILNLFFNSATFGTFEFYKNPTITANGTAQTINNLNSNFSTVSTATLYTAPTISANGTLIAVFCTETSTREVYTQLQAVLKANDNLLIRRTQGGGAGNEIRMNLIWSEQ